MSQMYLVVTVRKQVDDRDQGQVIFDHVKDKLADRPDLTITGHVTNHFDLDPDPPG